MVGLPGSGKTTFFRQRLAGTHVHVSGDAARGRGRERSAQLGMVGAALAAGRSVAVDNTNPTAAGRAEFVALAKATGATAVCYYFPPDVAASLARNSLREGRARVPPVAIHAAMRRMEVPTSQEGFDGIYLVNARRTGTVLVRRCRPAPFRSRSAPR